MWVVSTCLANLQSKAADGRCPRSQTQRHRSCVCLITWCRAQPKPLRIWILESNGLRAPFGRKKNFTSPNLCGHWPDPVSHHSPMLKYNTIPPYPETPFWMLPGGLMARTGPETLVMLLGWRTIPKLKWACDCRAWVYLSLSMYNYIYTCMYEMYVYAHIYVYIYICISYVKYKCADPKIVFCTHAAKRKDYEDGSEFYDSTHNGYQWMPYGWLRSMATSNFHVNMELCYGLWYLCIRYSSIATQKEIQGVIYLFFFEIALVRSYKYPLVI